MELPRILHDELLHKVDEPHDQHVANVLHAAEVYVPTKDKERAHIGERSPLVKPTPSGEHLIVVDVDRVEAILNAEERAAVAADASLRTWDIVAQEAGVLAKLAVPMVRLGRAAQLHWTIGS